LVLVGIIAISTKPESPERQAYGVLAVLVGMGLGIWWLNTRAQRVIVFSDAASERIGSVMAFVVSTAIRLLTAAVVVGAVLGVIYGLVRFVKWAWVND
jgi:hypothetical protein